MPGTLAAAPQQGVGHFGSSIAAARNADGRLELFGADRTQGVWHRWQRRPGGDWSGWEKFDGVLRP
ncbi:hypothetical protein [Streptomyces telluris]|uniref:PLL-like beta propeller domain-containing protein n=1 Tax=Streptomyces telluris TaxID=2720021 RepID=A0A9X2LMB8_9ACTN|nr:hypothetical protein [Streptomyces telluris]MCQ8773576.1 hypothetical protein [Streptomyces telluris]NJP81747.1 hypothetical protein [Streptomyces telluris]